MEAGWGKGKGMRVEEGRAREKGEEEENNEEIKEEVEGNKGEVGSSYTQMIKQIFDGVTGV